MFRVAFFLEGEGVIPAWQSNLGSGGEGAKA